MKIKLSKSQWEGIGKKAGWNPLNKNQLLNEASDLLDRAGKILNIAEEIDLAIELQKLDMRILDKRTKEIS
jgi:hypothetical protein